MTKREKILNFHEEINKHEDFNLIKESFPHISKKIELLCGDIILHKFFTSLMMDSRDGNRQGFPKHIASAIVRIEKFHETFFEEELTLQQKVTVKDVWGHEKVHKPFEITGIDFIKYN